MVFFKAIVDNSMETSPPELTRKLELVKGWGTVLFNKKTALLINTLNILNYCYLWWRPCQRLATHVQY